MDDAQMMRISKFLSKHLRHQPERIGLRLEDGGWLGVEALLAACARHGIPVVFLVDASAMARDGHVFYRSANDVWLVEHVPPQYLRRL